MYIKLLTRISWGMFACDIISFGSFCVTDDDELRRTCFKQIPTFLTLAVVSGAGPLCYFVLRYRPKRDLEKIIADPELLSAYVRPRPMSIPQGILIDMHNRAGETSAEEFPTLTEIGVLEKHEPWPDFHNH